MNQELLAVIQHDGYKVVPIAVDLSQIDSLTSGVLLVVDDVSKLAVESVWVEEKALHSLAISFELERHCDVNFVLV